MYGVFTYIYPQNYPNVDKSTIHWVSGIGKRVSAVLETRAAQVEWARLFCLSICSTLRILTPQKWLFWGPGPLRNTGSFTPPLECPWGFLRYGIMWHSSLELCGKKKTSFVQNVQTSPRDPITLSEDDWGVQSPPKRIVFWFHYHSQKVIGSLQGGPPTTYNWCYNSYK